MNQTGNRTARDRKRYLLLVLALVGCGMITFAQSRGGSWPTFGGDAQRSGWEGADSRLSVSTVKNLQLLWRLKLETRATGLRSILPPIVQGRLISYRGFKELAFVATSADIVYSIDADLGAMFWQRHLEYSTREPQVLSSTWRCPGGLTAMPTMPVPGRGLAPPAAPAAGVPPPPGAQPQRGSAFIGGPPSVYAISSDGRLHRLNTSTGDEMTQPVSVIPANARAHTLNMVGNVIYTVTSHDCNDAPDAVWAVDLNVDPPKVQSFELKTGSGWGLSGPVIGSDGTVYVSTGDGTGEQSSAVLALSPRDLELKHQFSLPQRSAAEHDAALSDVIHSASPVVFSYKERDVIVTPCGDDQLCLFDSAVPGSSDRSSPAYRTPPLLRPERDTSKLAERGITGSLSSWQDAEGTRWVFAAVAGPIHEELKFPAENGRMRSGFIAAFKVQEQGSGLTLTPAWISRDMDSPLPPVIASGVVFALSAGELSRKISDDGQTTDERLKGRATLFALDAQTGLELYSSRNLVTGPAALTGLTVANGRVYFGGADGTLYAFGMYMER